MPNSNRCEHHFGTFWEPKGRCHQCDLDRDLNEALTREQALRDGLEALIKEHTPPKGREYELSFRPKVRRLQELLDSVPTPKGD